MNLLCWDLLYCAIPKQQNYDLAMYNNMTKVRMTISLLLCYINMHIISISTDLIEEWTEAKYADLNTSVQRHR